MNLDTERPLVARARLLLIAMLGAVVWLMLSLVGGSNSAEASENHDSLLDTISGSVMGLSPLPTVTTPIVASIDRGGPEPVVNGVAREHATRALSSSIVATVDIADQVMGTVVADALEIGDDLTANLGGTLDPDDADSSSVMMNPAPAAASAARATRPEPAAMLETAAADTRAAQVPAAGSTDSPSTPGAPPVPVSTASSPGAGNQIPLASLPAFGANSMAEETSAEPRNDTLPSSPTFDGDTSPD